MFVLPLKPQVKGCFNRCGARHTDGTRRGGGFSVMLSLAGSYGESPRGNEPKPAKRPADSAKWGVVCELDSVFLFV